jgi:hypothetical protein
MAIRHEKIHAAWILIDRALRQHMEGILLGETRLTLGLIDEQLHRQSKCVLLEGTHTKLILTDTSLRRQIKRVLHEESYARLIPTDRSLLQHSEHVLLEATHTTLILIAVLLKETGEATIQVQETMLGRVIVMSGPSRAVTPEQIETRAFGIISIRVHYIIKRFNIPPNTGRHRVHPMVRVIGVHRGGLWALKLSQVSILTKSFPIGQQGGREMRIE